MPFLYYSGFFISHTCIHLTIRTMISTQSELACIDGGTNDGQWDVSFTLHPCRLVFKFLM